MRLDQAVWSSKTQAEARKNCRGRSSDGKVKVKSSLQESCLPWKSLWWSPLKWKHSSAGYFWVGKHALRVTYSSVAPFCK